MKLLSCFMDETGQQDMRAGYYMITLVFHDQSKSIEQMISAYERRLSLEQLPDIPFHAVDLLHGHGEYADSSPETRKRLLVAFSMFVRTLPVTFHTLYFDSSDVHDLEQLRARMSKDLLRFIEGHLEMFQSFDKVPIYYDGGHEVVTDVIHRTFGTVLAKGAVLYKGLSHQDKRLAQAADYLCTIEMASRRYASNRVSRTYIRFFGEARNFKQNYLKQIRKKRLD